MRWFSPRFAQRPSSDAGRPVGAPVEQRFGDVFPHDAIRAGQIGDRARDAGDAVECAGADRAAADGAFEESERIGGERAEPPQVGGGDRGIRRDACAVQA